MLRKIIITLSMVLAIALSQNLYVKNDNQVRLSPRLINYQGYLTDTLGIPITNPSLAMTFSIYDAQSAGNLKWTENQTVSVSKGIFNVILGINTPIPDSVFNSTERWLELIIDGAPLTPRTRLVSQPYAYTATYSDTALYAKNAAADNDWIISGNNMYSGVSGNVGIGTTGPGAKLDVAGHIWQTSTGQSVFLGQGAGQNDDLTYNNNVFVGYQAGYNNTTGYDNTALGFRALYSNTSGYYNTASGFRALYSNTSGYYNTASGFQALYSNTTGNYNNASGGYALYSNTTGGYNTANGCYALYSNTTGNSNIASGYTALYNNTTGNYNIAIGNSALSSNTTGSNNTASGVYALYMNTTAGHNIAIGERALYSQSYDNAGTPWNSFNIALGDSALFSNQPTSTSNGIYNTALGHQALRYNTTGFRNTASGYQTLYSNTTGNLNTAVGYRALYSNTDGWRNIAYGTQVLYSNTGGSDNTASGYYTLYSNTTGNYNTAVGSRALYSNTTAGHNIAIGQSALYSQSYNNAGTPWNSFNIAIGDSALFSNQPTSTLNGIYNTALGHRALRYNTTGTYNTASGYQALYSNTTGTNNTAIGHLALFYNTSHFNTAIGSNALYSNTTGGYNTAIGYYALSSNTTGSYNTAVGSYTATNGNSDNTVALGYLADPTASNRVHIGNTSITWIGGQVTWSTYSDARAKTDVRENIPGLEFIMKLKPVSFNWDTKALNQLMGVVDTAEWRGKYDIEKKRISGFLAQDVAKAARECNYDFSGIDSTANVYSLSYAQFVVPLVKAVQEQQAQIEKQQAEIEELKAQLKIIQERMGK
ncbi:MAG: tail fiber domain-containing protein [candidate division WOR-3 bacterium]